MKVFDSAPACRMTGIFEMNKNFKSSQIIFLEIILYYRSNRIEIQKMV